MILRTLLVLATALALFACGGGGGDQSSDSPVAVIPPDPGPPQPKPDTGPKLLPFPYVQPGQNGIPAYNLAPLPHQGLADVRRIPVYQDGERLLVGIDQTADHVGALSTVSKRGETSIRHGSLDDGAPSDHLATYLSLAPEGLASRFEQAPTVRFVGDLSNQTLVDRTLEGIRLVNAALPEHFQIRVPSLTPVAPTGNFGPHRLTYSPDGTAESNTIYIEFVDDIIAFSGLTARWRPSGTGAIDHAYIDLRKNSKFGGDVHLDAVSLVTHELLHALGFEHVPSNFVSILDRAAGAVHAARRPLTVLHPLDREALQILYTRLENDADPTDFGPWASTSVHIAGNAEHSNFGVALRNGYAEPWAYGLKPTTMLSANPALSGTVTWEGSIVGLTPDAASVVGDAAIGVDLSTMNGTAEFTALESWSAGTSPGSAGTGAQWLDGDLGYTISVNGNSFRETGGDTGSVNGVFTGPSHEGTAGTLERSDLTAAFGASR